MNDPYADTRGPDEDYRAPHDQPHQRGARSDEHSTGMLCHLLSLTGYLTGIGFIVGPLIPWLMKKDESSFVDACGREALNFQITVLGLVMTSIVAAFTIIGIPVAIVLWVLIPIWHIAMPIIAGIKAGDGEVYRIPFTLRLL